VILELLTQEEALTQELIKQEVVQP
jgi:hypothetical protein